MKLNNKKIFKDSFVIGAALFSMFFGAGNMIFPPYLGLRSGTEWFSGFLGYYIADIGLAILAIFAQIKTGGYKGLLKPIGKTATTVLMMTVVLCIGPIISIPRTAATTFELSISPIFENFNMPLFYVIFFAVVLLMSINKSALVDIVGKILTPVLFLGLMLLIIKGVCDPLGVIEMLPRTQSPVADGIEAGYQSMDVLAAIIFGVLILDSARDKGHTEKSATAKVSVGAGLVSGIGLLIIYLGLTYLGATVSSQYDMHIYRTELLIALIESLLPGKFGTVFFSVVAGFACLSTAVALTGSAAEYFSQASNGKISYKRFVVMICVFSGGVSLFGVEMLIKIASPILNVVYPPILVMILLSFFGEKSGTIAHKFAAVGATAFGVFEALKSFGVVIPFIEKLPFASLGLSWILPCVILFIVGIVCEKILVRIKNV